MRDEIAACIKEDHFPDFVKKVFELEFILQTVKDSLDSLDHSVSHHLKLRYLFLHVYEKLYINSQNFEQFLVLLSEQGVSCDILDRVRMTCKSYSTQGLYSQISMDTEMLADGISRALVGMKRQCAPGFFLERHISTLTEILAPCSYKWHEIGMSLNLPYGVLEDILERFNANLCTTKLSKVLKEWIMGFHEYAKPPTEDSLRQALASNIVGLGAEANALHDNLIKHGVYIDEDETQSSAPAKRPCIEASPLTIARQPHGMSGALVGEKRPRRSGFFSSKHISALTEILAPCSYKWREISTCLNLPYHICENIHQLREENNIKLNKVLEKWIVGFHEYTKPPTENNLKNALASILVGLGAEANALHDNLIDHGVYIDDDETQSSAPAKRPCLEASPLTIACQTRGTWEIKEGKSILFEVDVNSDLQLSYEWMKDGSTLNEEDLSVHREILCIRDVNLTSEGTYACTIRNDSNEEVKSDPVTLKVEVPIMRKILIDRYSKPLEITESLWPPACNNTYINFALIKTGKIHNTKGDMDDILSNKESVEFEDVFCNLESGTRMLIEGRPGSGKTTLVHKVSRDWANNKLKQVIFILILINTL